MTNPNVLIFAPRDEPAQVLAQLEDAGVRLSYGEKDWQWVKADHEDALIAAARQFKALYALFIGTDATQVEINPLAVGSVEGVEVEAEAAAYAGPL